jgi:ribosomal protein S18 acetylase RimI-like enzyme
VDLSTQIAKEHDKKYFFELYSDSMKSHIETLWGWDQDWQANDSEERWNLSVNYILFNADKRIGYFQVTEEKDGAYIMMFIIDNKFRSKGVGRNALNMLKNLLLNKPLSLRVFKTNSRALSFYIANGFSITKQEDKFYIMHQRVA